MKGLLTVIGGSPVAIAAFAAAAAYGIYRLIDWASGAKAARDAQERLNDTVKQWGENVTTAYEKSKGLSQFGLTADDFSVENIGTDWLSQTIATWRDGKRETDQIVADTVKGFTDGTEKIRASLQTLKDSAGGTALGDLDGDLEALEAIDKEVQQILKRRQNGLLTDDDTARLQALMDQRDAIRIRYRLVADSESAFGQITEGVEAALSRGADGAATFTDAYAAATQGLGAFTDSLNQEYDTRYKVISAMEDGAEKERQLGELRTWYDSQAQAATEQYYNTLKQTAEATGVFAEGGKFAETASELQHINELMHAAAGKDSMSAEMTALRDALAGLDESGIVEMEAAIAAMEAACADAGVEVPANVQAARAALEEVKSTATDTSNVFSDDVADSIDTMFSGLDGEVHEVYATLNCDSLSTAYDAWAAGEHTPIIPQLDTTSMDITALSSLEGKVTALYGGESVTVDISMLDALSGTVTVISDSGEATTVSISQLEGLTGTVTGVTGGSAVSVDISTLDALKGTVTAIGDNGQATTVSLSRLSALEGTVTAIHEGSTVSVDVSSIDTLNGTVTVIGDNGEATTVTISSLSNLQGTCTAISGNAVSVDIATLDSLKGTVTVIGDNGEATTVSLASLKALEGTVSAITESGESVTVDLATLDALTGTVTVYNDYDTASTASLTSLSGLQGTVTGYTQGANVTFNAAELQKLTGTVTTINVSADAAIPTMEMEGTVKRVNFEQGQYTTSGNPQIESEASNQRESRNAIGMTDWAAPETVERLHNLAQAVRDLNAAKAEVAGMEAAGIPDVTAYDQATQKVAALSDSVQTLGESFGGEMVAEGGIGFQNMAQYVANGMQLMNDGAMDGSKIEEYTQVVSDLTTVMNSQAGEAAASVGTVGTTLSDGMADAMNGYDWNTTGSTVMSDIIAGFASAGGDLSQLGDDIGAGIGSGEAAHDFSGDAESTIANDEAALRSAAASQSPAQRFVPLGDDIGAGVGQGMAQHDFSGDAESMISVIQSAFAGASFTDAGATIAQGVSDGMGNANVSGGASTLSGNIRKAVARLMTASLLKIYGTTAASGVASGMGSYSFGSAGSSVAGKVKSAVSGSLNSSTLHSTGVSAMSGLAAGIRSGSASVVSAIRAAAQAAVSAAKAELQIHSPSRVFRDEVGMMVMKGFGAGIEGESRNQAKIIANASRYLTTAARDSAMGTANDNRRTYNNQSSVSLTGNTFIIRNEEDARNLAIKIASLTKKQQAGYSGNGVTAVSG